MCACSKRRSYVSLGRHPHIESMYELQKAWELQEGVMYIGRAGLLWGRGIDACCALEVSDQQEG